MWIAKYVSLTKYISETFHLDLFFNLYPTRKHQIPFKIVINYFFHISSFGNLGEELRK
jgi:hypothetical protein